MLTQFPLCMHALPPLASVSRAEGMAFLDSPESMETLRSRLDLVFSIPPTLLTDWLTVFSPGLPGEIWLVLTPWLPAPTPFGPRWPAAPCCCWACWFTLGIWDRLSLVTCLPWLASLLSGCIWLAGDWGGGLIWRIAVPVCQWHSHCLQETLMEKRKITIISISDKILYWALEMKNKFGLFFYKDWYGSNTNLTATQPVIWKCKIMHLKLSKIIIMSLYRVGSRLGLSSKHVSLFTHLISPRHSTDALPCCSPGHFTDHTWTWGTPRE